MRAAVRQFASTPHEVFAQFASDAKQNAAEGSDEIHGFISRSGFKQLLVTMGIEASDHDRKAIRKSLDKSDDKKIWLSEFEAFMAEDAGQAATLAPVAASAASGYGEPEPDEVSGGVAML